MELVDTHCHLDVDAFDDDRDSVLARARANGVVAQIVPAIDATRWEPLLALCRSEPDLFPALGLHPVYVDHHKDADLPALEKRIADTRPVAVGEIGLDFRPTTGDPSGQRRFFEAQLAIARDADLPVVVHVIKAHDEAISLIRKSGVCGGTIHAFNGSLQQGRIYRDLGFLLGFGGMLTFDRSTKLRRLAQELPLDAIALETDAPDLTVASHQGQRNSPEFLPEVVAAMAKVRNQPPEEIARATTVNARHLFRLSS